jgi:ribosomal protein L11 methyltransferase
VAESLAGLSPVVAGRFAVHGAHDRDRLPPHRIAIEIEAALAFGTGHHGTTRGCLLALDRWLKSRRPRQTRVLDVGTGTGVLAIAAAKAIGRSVLANDIDPAAIAIARENARSNGVGPRVVIVRASGMRARALASGRYDLVFANILLSPLKRMAAALARRTAAGGTLVLSGLLRDQANAALSIYRLQGLRLRWRIELEGWTTLCLTRVGSRAQKSRPDQGDRDRR